MVQYKIEKRDLKSSEGKTRVMVCVSSQTCYLIETVRNKNRVSNWVQSSITPVVVVVSEKQ